MPDTQTTQRASTGQAVALIVMTLLGWSSVPLFLKHFSHAIDVWTSNGWRYGFSALLWAPVLLIGLKRRSLPRGLWRNAIVPSIFNCAGQTCFAAAHYIISPGLLTFGLRMQILFVGVGAYLLLPQERRVIRTRSYLVGAVLVLGGTLGTIFLGEKPPDFSSGLGVTLAIAAGLLFACYALSVRHYMRQTSSITAFAVISQYTAAVMVGLMLALGERSGAAALDLDPLQFGLLLLSAIIGIALGHVFYYAAIAKLGVAIASGVVQLQPFLVTAASYFLFGERMTPWQLVGGAVAISGAALMLSVQHRLSKQDRAAKELAQAEAQQA